MSLRPVTPGEVKLFRESIGVSQAGLADLLGYTTNAVEKWEAGRNAPAVVRLAFAAINENLKPWEPSAAQSLLM